MTMKEACRILRASFISRSFYLLFEEELCELIEAAAPCEPLVSGVRRNVEMSVDS